MSASFFTSAGQARRLVLLYCALCCGCQVPAAPAASVDLPAPADALAPMGPRPGLSGLAEFEVFPDPAGHTAGLALPPMPGAGATLLLQIDAPADHCVQVLDLRDETTAWVEPPQTRDDLGPYCVSCSQRVSVLHGSGLYVLPSSDAPFAPQGPLLLRLGARDCTSLLSTQVPPGERWRVGVRWLGPPAPEAPGTLTVDFFLTSGSALAVHPAPRIALAEVLHQVNQMLAPGLLSVTLGEVISIDAPDPLRFATDDMGPLERVIQRGGGGTLGGGVPVLLAGCLQQVDPLLGRTAEPDGFVPRVPGGWGAADGIYLRGRACFASASPDAFAAATLAKLLAHELGHYLGLYHTVEEDGRTDPISDTDERNLMYFQPLVGFADGLSAGQFRVLRRHPLWRWP